eukprot:scaffold51881_cov53-Attheya_sp.AAC.1
MLDSPLALPSPRVDTPAPDICPDLSPICAKSIDFDEDGLTSRCISFLRVEPWSAFSKWVAGCRGVHHIIEMRSIDASRPCGSKAGKFIEFGQLIVEIRAGS